MTQEEKARAYDKAIEKIKYVMEHGVSPTLSKEDLQDIFPELKESEDERIIKAQLDYWRSVGGKEWHGVPVQETIAWLEKQCESDKSLYIRFGDIPTNGKSKVYNGEIEIGIEEGISVYPAFEDKEGNIILGLNLPITKTSLHTQQHLLEYDNRPCYIVTGDYVGKGTDGEPLIKNVRIIKEIKPYRVKEDKENNTYVINNTPNCGISVYNEELKESEDERVRKAVISYIDYEAQRGGEWFGVKVDDIIAWLEKQGKQKEYTFKSLPRLLDMIKPTSRAKAYCQKLIDTLVKEGYATDAKIVGECLKIMNGEDIPMAIMDEKQGEYSSTVGKYFLTPEESLDISSEKYNEIVDECIFGDKKPQVDGFDAVRENPNHHEGWVNIYKCTNFYNIGIVHKCKSDALGAVQKYDSTYVATIKIEWEEYND